MLMLWAMMRVIDNGINMFQIRYEDSGVPRIWRLNSNWTFIIIGAVILQAVILDQGVHMVHAARSRRGVAPPNKPSAGRGPDRRPHQPTAAGVSARVPP